MNKNDTFRSFVRWILGIDAFSVIVSLALAWNGYGLSVFAGVLVAMGLTTANVLAGYWVIVRTKEETMAGFMKRAFSAMVVRMVLLLGFIVFFLLKTKIDQNSFIISLFIFYICKSVIEIIFIKKQRSEPQPQR